MREAVVVATARTGIGRAYRGSLNHTKSPALLGHVMDHALQRAGVAARTSMTWSSAPCWRPARPA